MMGFIKYGLLILLVVALAIIAYQYSECQRKGKAKAGSFKCGFFSREPISILPVDEYYDVRGDECYHYIDFGDSMSIKKVSIDKCN